MTLVLLLLRAQIGGATRRNHDNAPPPRVDLRLSTNTLTVMLCIASIACCVAMAMPQVQSSPIAAISATAWRAAPRCCR